MSGIRPSLALLRPVIEPSKFWIDYPSQATDPLGGSAAYPHLFKDKGDLLCVLIQRPHSLDYKEGYVDQRCFW